MQEWEFCFTFVLSITLKLNKMKSFRPYAIAIGLFFIWLLCQSCSTDEIQTQPTNSKFKVEISNGGKPFEYWLDKTHFSSQGETINRILTIGTQITIGAIVEVKNNVEIKPNIQIKQNEKLVEIHEVTKSFYWYEVK